MDGSLFAKPVGLNLGAEAEESDNQLLCFFGLIIKLCVNLHRYKTIYHEGRHKPRRRINSDNSANQFIHFSDLIMN